ncbi:MAG: LysM domain-containing protein [Acidimicrobiia bacterium]
MLRFKTYFGEMRWLGTVTLGVLALMAGGVARAGPVDAPVRLPIHPFEANLSLQVTVRPGDHLWKISASHLVDRLEREVGTNEISPYWRSVITMNRSHLRSGDPDLIYPGEVIVLPPIEISEPP